MAQLWWRFVATAALMATAVYAQAAPPAGKPAAKPLAYLRARVGDGPWTLWKTQPLHRRLAALLGAKEWAALQLNMDPAEPLSDTAGILSSTGLRAHMGYEEEGVLVIDVEHDVLEVLLMHAGKTVHGWAERNAFIPLPAPVLTTVQHWPQEALQQTLARLEHASAQTTTDSVEPAAPHAPQAASLPQKSEGASPALSPVFAKIGQALEVQGVRIGMPAAQARAVVTSQNARMQQRPAQFTLTDLPGLVLTSGVNYLEATNRQSHSINLGFTLSPKLAAVWGVGRMVDYDEDTLPSIATTMTALRTKYGPESVYKEEPIMHQRSLIWILDAAGNPVPQDQAPVIADSCTNFYVNPETAKNDVVDGWEHDLPQQLDCTPFSFLHVTLTEWEPTRADRTGRMKPPGLLRAMNEQAMCYPLRRVSYEATVAAANKARTRKEQEESTRARGQAAPL